MHQRWAAAACAGARGEERLPLGREHLRARWALNTLPSWSPCTRSDTSPERSGGCAGCVGRCPLREASWASCFPWLLALSDPTRGAERSAGSSTEPSGPNIRAELCRRRWQVAKGTSRQGVESAGLRESQGDPAACKGQTIPALVYPLWREPRAGALPPCKHPARVRVVWPGDGASAQGGRGVDYQQSRVSRPSAPGGAAWTSIAVSQATGASRTRTAPDGSAWTLRSRGSSEHLPLITHPHPSDLPARGAVWA